MTIEKAVAALDREIKQKQQERKVMFALEIKLAPFLSEVKNLCAQFPDRQNTILKMVASDLGIQSEELGVKFEQSEVITQEKRAKNRFGGSPCAQAILGQ